MVLSEQGKFVNRKARVDFTQSSSIFITDFLCVSLISNCGCNEALNKTDDAYYDYPCTKAKAEYKKLFPDKTLKLENDYGPGSECFHWDEDAFDQATGSSELMTPVFEIGIAQPITRVTIAALDDAFTDYVVNYDAADPFPFTNAAPDAYVDGNEIPYVANKHKVWVPTKTLNYNIVRDNGGRRLLV